LIVAPAVTFAISESCTDKVSLVVPLEKIQVVVAEIIPLAAVQLTGPGTWATEINETQFA
jgi:hypothetical protein